MTNLMVSVILPKGLRLKDGKRLYQDATFTFTSQLSPFYTSIAIVRLAGGPMLNKLPDLTIAGAIFNVSQQADSHTYVFPPEPVTNNPLDPSFRRKQLFLNARSNWVSGTVAADLLGAVADLSGLRGSKTLANFSVEKLTGVNSEGIPQKVQDLNKEAEKWRIVLNSGGDVGFGGHVKGSWGAKALFDVDAPAGRTWVVTGMGANSKTAGGFGSSGKPVKYASGPLLAWRLGRYYGPYSVPYMQNSLPYSFIRS
jgi:hypothetical protein